MRKRTATVVLAAFIATFVHQSSQAGFERWTAEVKTNPFSGGTDVTVLYNVSIRSQVQITCDSGKSGISIVAIPGYEAPDTTLFLDPKVRIEVDGTIILENIDAKTSAYGANLLGVEISLDRKEADTLTDAFVSARRQIAIEDGLSNKPFLLTARGSTASARKVKQCYEAQKGLASEPAADDDPIGLSSRAERIADLEARIEKLQAELSELRSE